MIIVDDVAGVVIEKSETGEITYPLTSARGFDVVSRAWLRATWDAKYVYSFTWLGRPIIQLPEDLIRVQEVIYRIKPTIIIETGVAHGGSAVFFASLCKLMGGGHVIGVDIEIRPHNRRAIEAHELSSNISLIEGSSTDPAIIDSVRSQIAPADTVFVFLDSNHSKDHVLAELRGYAPLVTIGSYIVVADGIAADLAGAPRTRPDWAWDNPAAAIDEFLREAPDFVSESPAFAFNEGMVTAPVTYWTTGYLRRTR